MGCKCRLQPQSAFRSWRRCELCEGESNHGVLPRHWRRVLSVLNGGKELAVVQGNGKFGVKLRPARFRSVKMTAS